MKNKAKEHRYAYIRQVRGEDNVPHVRECAITTNMCYARKYLLGGDCIICKQRGSRMLYPTIPYQKISDKWEY